MVLPPWAEYQADRAVGFAARAWARADLPSAASWAEQAVSHAPDHGPAWLALARCRVDLGRHDAAAETLPHLERLLPDEPDAAALRGRIAVETGARSAAIDAFVQLESLDPTDVRAPLGLALVAARLDGDWEAMLDRLRRAMAIDDELQPAMLPLRAAWAPLTEDPAFLGALSSLLTEDSATR